MDSLKTLIEEFEAEKNRLLRLIEEAVKEEEFLIAHFHYEALAQVNYRLQRLKTLDDELYSRKYHLEGAIGRLKKASQQETDSTLKSTIDRQIAIWEIELNKLTETPKKQRQTNGQSHFRDSIEQFAKAKIKGLRVTLNKSNNLVIEIKKAKVGVRLAIPNINKLRTQNLLDDEALAKLNGLGFYLNKKGDKATATLTENKIEIPDKIMKLISIIVFEVFYFESGNDAAIEILW